MREILFRGKTPNGEWVEGYYGQFHNRPAVNEPNSHQIFEPKENAVVFGSCIGGLWHKVIPETVGQYIGANDCTGTKIFEGDIVEYKEDIGCITYSNEEAMFVVEFDTWFTDFDHLYSTQLEIIGNIHDNPELLKGGVTDNNVGSKLKGGVK